MGILSVVVLFSITMRTAAFEHMVSHIASLSPVSTSSIRTSHYSTLVCRALLRCSCRREPCALMPSVTATVPRVDSSNYVCAFAVGAGVFFATSVSFKISRGNTPQSHGMITSSIVCSFGELTSTGLTTPKL